MFYLPHYLFRALLVITLVFGTIHLIFEPSQNSWYSIGLGILCLVIFFTIFAFTIVRNLQPNRRLKNIKWWVNFHIYGSFILWVLVLFHTSFEFDSSFFYIYTAASILVLLTGIAGQYFFIKIPRTHSGLEEGKAEIVKASEHHAMKLLKLSITDDALLNYMGKVDNFIRETLMTTRRKNLRSLIANDIKIYQIKLQFKKEFERGLSRNESLEEYKALIFKRLTIDLKIAHMSITKGLLKLWNYIHFGAIHFYVLIIFFHVYSKLITTNFAELVFWNWK